THRRARAGCRGLPRPTGGTGRRPVPLVGQCGLPVRVARRRLGPRAAALGRGRGSRRLTRAPAGPARTDAAAGTGAAAGTDAAGGAAVTTAPGPDDVPPGPDNAGPDNAATTGHPEVDQTLATPDQPGSRPLAAPPEVLV